MPTTSVSARGRPKGRRSPGRPKLEDVAEIEHRLLSVALKEFVAHGYGGASLNAIVKAAGVSKTTLYSRFPTKEHLFRAIVKAQIERLDAASVLRPPAGSRPDLETGLKAYANHMLELGLKGEFLEVNRLVFSESSRFPELGLAAAERNALGTERIARFVRECAVSDGVPCRDPEGVAEAFIHMMRGWYVNIMLTNRKMPAAQRQRWVERAVHTLLSARADW